MGKDEVKVAYSADAAPHVDEQRLSSAVFIGSEPPMH